ncbi:hypothetical protein ADK52_00035 [Streptomyces sp. WM6372]|nr:hypothetical protein ADK52_00035 [Streptomyces sp. WM6372]
MLLRRKATCAAMLLPGVGGRKRGEGFLAEAEQVLLRVLVPAQLALGALLAEVLASQVDIEAAREEKDVGPVGPSAGARNRKSPTRSAGDVNSTAAVPLPPSRHTCRARQLQQPRRRSREMAAMPDGQR